MRGINDNLAAVKAGTCRLCRLKGVVERLGSVWGGAVESMVGHWDLPPRIPRADFESSGLSQ